MGPRIKTLKNALFIKKKSIKKHLIKNVLHKLAKLFKPNEKILQ